MTWAKTSSEKERSVQKWVLEAGVPVIASQAHSSALLWSTGDKLSLDRDWDHWKEAKSGSSLPILVSCFSVSTAFGLFSVFNLKWSFWFCWLNFKFYFKFSDSITIQQVILDSSGRTKLSFLWIPIAIICTFVLWVHALLLNWTHTIPIGHDCGLLEGRKMEFLSLYSPRCLAESTKHISMHFCPFRK